MLPVLRQKAYSSKTFHACISKIIVKMSPTKSDNMLQIVSQVA
jgi:hypothetical protein